jgi:hypothetical protein
VPTLHGFKELQLVGLRSLIGLSALLLTVVTTVLFFTETDTAQGANGISVKEITGCTRALAYNDAAKVERYAQEQLVVKALVLTNASCGGFVIDAPSFTRAGNVIELDWRWKNIANGAVAGYRCTKHLEFTIPLPEPIENLQIEIKRK